MPIPKYYFHYDSEKPQITRRYALIGQSVPDESGGPGLLAWTLFLFLIYRWNLRPTVYGGSTLVTKVV
jgi:hypothetical protein